MVVHDSMDRVFQSADRVVEGKVISKHSIVSESGSIITLNTINVNREFGAAQTKSQLTVITEGGVVGSLAQVVYPSVSLNVGSTGLFALHESQVGLKVDQSFSYDQIEKKFSTPIGSLAPEELYHLILHAMETATVSLLNDIEDLAPIERAAAPQIVSFSPSVLSAGSSEELTITGSGFGSLQGEGRVSFSNADNGGQGFVSLAPGPHYTSWSNSEIKVLVPSSMLFANVVAGTGMVRVTINSNETITSNQELKISYAHGEVIYEEEIGQTSLIGRINGGYELSVGPTLSSFLGGAHLVERSVDKWACNTGINFNTVDNEPVSEVFGMDDISVIGMAAPGTIPSNVLGKTVTTFSACGGGEGIEWQLREVDILFNPAINWYVGDGIAPSGTYDLQTVMIHELGHAHLLQHNNNEESVMYFQLNENASKRFLGIETDVLGGSIIVDRSIYDAPICSSDRMEFFNDSSCDHALVNSIEETDDVKPIIAPNPSNGNIVITGIELGETFTISDLSGRTVYSEVHNSGGSINLDLTDLRAGVYLFQIAGKGAGDTQKLVIQ